MKRLLCVLFLFFSVFVISQETVSDVEIAQYEKEFQALLFSYNMNKARAYYKKIINDGITTKNKNLEVLGYKMYGNLLQQLSKRDSSILIKKKALEINNNKRNKFYGDLTLNLAIAYAGIGQRDSTLTYLLESEKTYKKLKNYRGLCYLKNFSSTYYMQNNELFKSQKAIEELFTYNEVYKNKFFEGSYYFRMAQIKALLGSYKQAKLTGSKALEIFKESGNTNLYIQTTNFLIGINLVQEINWKESRELMDDVLRIIIDNKVADEDFIINLYFMNCTILLHENKTKEAELEIHKLGQIVGKYNLPVLTLLYKSTKLELLFKQKKIREFNELTKELNFTNKTPEIRLQYFRLLYKFYSKKNNSLALNHLENYWELKDSITNSTLLKNIAYNQEKFETRKKEKENLQLRNENVEQELATLNANRQKWIFAIGLLGALLALGVFAFYYRKNKKQKEVIESLQKELHHRVKNNLSIIDTFIEVAKEEFEDEKFTYKLTELQNRIDSINEVHLQLYQSNDITNVNIRKYVDTLSQNVQNSFNNSKTSIESDVADSLQLDPNKSFPLGLIINEFLTNSFKHAFGEKEGEIRIAINETNTNLELLLSDNGKGLPKNFDIQESESFGLRIMKLLSEQLDGSFDLQSNDGVNLIIQFPK